MIAMWVITGDVNLDDSVRVMVARFLHGVVTLFPSSFVRGECEDFFFGVNFGFIVFLGILFQ